MSSPKDFKMELHTAVKHDILRRYLECWFPILGRRYRELAYIDGFAGPGIYSKKEPGSPIIALETANKQVDQSDADVHFWFIEKDSDCVATLRSEIGKIRPKLSPHIKTHDIQESEFELAFPEIVDKLQNGHDVPPTFVFVDPFGYSDVKMETIVNFLKNPHCEVFINFMSGPISRFLTLPGDVRASKLDNLFGTGKWRDCMESKNEKERISKLLAIYATELKSHGVKHVKMFEMDNTKDRPIYSLVFATNHHKGLEVMKDAMATVDKTFEFRFSDAIDPRQTRLYQFDDDNAWQLGASRMLHANFRGMKATIEEIKHYILIDTPYIYRSGILKLLEKDDPPKIKVVTQNKRRKDTYPGGSMITFAP